MVTLIYAKDCKDCEKMEEMINLSLQKNNLDWIIVDKISSDNDDAINIAIESHIEDIPACIIGDCVFYGKSGFDYESINKAVEKLRNLFCPYCFLENVEKDSDGESMYCRDCGRYFERI